MVSGPMIPWQIDGETMEAVTDFIFWGSKITADGDWSHEIKRCLLLGRKAVTNLDSVLKSRDITLPTKVHLLKTMVFPVVMYGWKCWTVKKAAYQRIDAFKLWCWRWLLRVLGQQGDPTSQSWRKSTLNIHWKGWCWNWSASTLATWCKELTLWKRPWCWKRLRAGEGNNIEWDGWMASSTQWTWVWASSGRWWRAGKPGVLQSMGSQRIRHNLVTKQQETGNMSYNLTIFVVQSLSHVDISLGNLDSSLWVIQPGILHDVLSI